METINWIEILGLVAGALSCASFVPQITKLLRSKTAEGVSRRAYIVTVTTFTLWTVYGVLNAQFVLIISNGICVALSATILALQVRYSGRPAQST